VKTIRRFVHRVRSEAANFRCLHHKGKPVERGLMARKLNVYQTFVGVLRSGISGAIDESGLGGLGSNSDPFHQGVATKPIRARRLLGSNQEFVEYHDITAEGIAAGRPPSKGVSRNRRPDLRCEHWNSGPAVWVPGAGAMESAIRSGDAGLLILTPEQERAAARSFVAQFLAGKIDVALRPVRRGTKAVRDRVPPITSTPRQGFALPLLARRVKVLSKYRIQEGSSKPAG